MSAHRLGKYLVYFNGIEVPAQRVDVTLSVGAPPQANIVLPPDRELLRLGKEDRLHVVVFYLDEYFRDPQKPDEYGQYRLIFEGEVVGWGYDSSSASRALNFSAVGLSSILTRIGPRLMTNIKGIQSGVVGPQGGENGAGTMTAAIADQLYPGALFFQGLQKVEDGKGPQKYIRRPYEFVQNVFKAMFGAAQFGKYNSAPSCHFFARWARRTNFLNRWIPSPYIEGKDLSLAAEGVFPMLWATRSQAAVGGLINLAQQVATQSVHAMLSTIFQVMYYEYTQLPNMPLVTVDLETGAIVGPPEFGEGAGGRGRGPKDPKRPLRLLNYVTKPELRHCAVPRCNIVFPSMITGYTFQESYEGQPTRFYVDNNGYGQIVAAGQNQPGTWSNLLTKTGFPKKVRLFLQKGENNKAFNDRNFLIFPEEYFRGPVSSDHAAPEWFSFFANKLYTTYLANAKASGKSDTDAETEATDLVRNTLDLYAEYEYMREKTSTRSGAVGMRFNPYILPGFPAVVFDREDTGVHIFCYVLNVTHSLSSSGLSTTANYAFAQTFDEFFESLIRQRNGLDDVWSGPTAELQKAQQALEKATADFKAMQATADAQSISMAEDTMLDAMKALDTAKQDALNKVYTELGAAREMLTAAEQTGEAVEAAQARVVDAQRALVQAEDAVNAPDMAPAHPIPDVRVRFQNFKSANEYYRTLLYQGVTDGYDAIFDWSKSVGVIDPRDPKSPAQPITLGSLQETALGDGKVERKVVGSNTVGYPSFGLLGSSSPPTGFRAYAANSELAMQYVARPIATLEEYIDFNGDYGLRDMPVEDDGPVKYYVKILDLQAGPGEAPAEDEYGNPKSLVNKDTRQDWETRLLNYRDKVKSKFFFTS